MKLLTVFLAFCSLTSMLGSEVLKAQVHQANGIKIGEVTQTRAIIWTRLTAHPQRQLPGIPWEGTDRRASSRIPDGQTLSDMEAAVPGIEGSVRVTCWPEVSPNEKRELGWVDVDPKQDFTHQFHLDSLRPGTSYKIQIDSRGANGGKGQTLEGSFRTAPSASESRPVTFMVVTGQEYWRRDDTDNGHRIYSLMQKLNPDFFVHTGDIIYYDKPKPLAKNIELARYKWNRQFSLPFQKNFHLTTASYFIKDDHDTLKNDCWPGQTYGELTWQNGLDIFCEQVPTGDRPYRTVRWGKDLQVWLVEGRDFRSANPQPDGPEKTIWGEDQKKWFFESVKSSDATFKILISPTPIVGPDRGKKNDNHANEGFAHEGQQIREFISQQPNMIVCCGDRHWQYVSVDSQTGVREYSCGPTTNQHAGGWSNSQRSPMHQYLNVVGGFLSVTIEPETDARPVAIFRHFGTDGKVLNEDRQIAK